MAAGGGISGPAVAMATAGAFMIYIGVRNVPVLDGLREITSGRLPAPRNKANTATRSVFAALYTTSGGDASAPAGGGAFPELVTAVGHYAGDHYSQARRWDDGYSDCSSFVGKGLKLIGVTPPGISVTGSYLVWGQLRKIERSEVSAGDLLVNAAHMTVATSNTDAIGQQNSRANVRRGAIESLMPGPFTCLRYVGPRGASVASMET